MLRSSSSFTISWLRRWGYGSDSRVSPNRTSKWLTNASLSIGLVDVCILLANLPLIYSLRGHKIGIFVLILFFFLRHLLCLVAAYPAARYCKIQWTSFALFFALPSLLLLHGFFIWESEGKLELWPPILFLDVLLFLPAVILNALVKTPR